MWTRVIFKIIISLGLLTSFYLELGKADEISLDKLDAALRDIISFRVEYVISIGPIQRATFVYKKNAGLVNDTVLQRENERFKIIENFFQDINLKYNYSKLMVEKIDYKSIPRQFVFDPRFIRINTLDFFMPFKYKTLKDNSIRIEGTEKIKDREFNIISAVINKYPCLGLKCRFWQAKDNSFIHKFIIYNEQDEPIFSLEVTEVEINPEIDDKEFSVEIPPDFKVIDITEEFAKQYRILVDLYNLYDSNEKMKRENEDLRKELEIVRKRLDEKELSDFKERYSYLDSLGREILEKLLSSISIAPKPFVLFVDRGLKFVIIGLGKINDVEIGDIFEVYRDNKVIGKIQVDRVYMDTAVAEAITEGLIERIKEGDKIVAVSRRRF